METKKNLSKNEIEQYAAEARAVCDIDSPIGVYAFDFVVDCPDVYGESTFNHLVKSIQSLDEAREASQSDLDLYADTTEAARLLRKAGLTFTRHT